MHADDGVAGFDQAEDVAAVEDGVAHDFLGMTALAAPRRMFQERNDAAGDERLSSDI